MIKPAAVFTLPLLSLPLLALAACNSNSRDPDDAAARPTADVTASDIATGAATMVPPVGSPGTPSDQAQTGAAPTPAPTDAGRSGVNLTTGTTGSGANRPNAGATTPAMPKE